MSKLALGEYYDNKYGQRFVITGFSKDYEGWEGRIEFYDVDDFDKWGDKWSMPLAEFTQQIKKGNLTHVA